MSAQEKKIFISLMPYLKDKSGHHFIYQLCVKQVIDAFMIPYLGYVWSECPSSIILPCWQKKFSSAERSLGYYRRLKVKYYDFSCAIRDAPIAASRIFFLDIVYKLDLLALTLAVWKYSKNSDQFWLVYRHPIPNTKWNIINVLTRILHRKLQHRLVTFTDSEKVRSTFQGLPFSPIVLPIPHTRHVFPKASAATPEKIICWWPGYPRAEKGWESIQKLVCVESPHAKFFVLVAAKAAKLTSKDTQIKVELIDDELSDDEFTQKLAECHIVLLPYDPHQYYARTSGIFVEAVVAHKIPLVKKNSWLASELERFDLHELIIDWDRPDFFSYILNIVNDQKIKTKLASMQKSYAKFHGMDVFKEKISAALNVD